MPVIGVKVKQKERNLVIFEDKPTNNLMKRSRRELSNDMVIRKGIFKNNQITHFPRFT